MAARGQQDCIISFQMSAGAFPLPALASRNINSARHYHWEARLPDQSGWTSRLLLHVLYCLRAHFRAVDGDHHARAAAMAVLLRQQIQL